MENNLFKDKKGLGAVEELEMLREAEHRERLRVCQLQEKLEKLAAVEAAEKIVRGSSLVTSMTEGSWTPVFEPVTPAQEKKQFQQEQVEEYRLRARVKEQERRGWRRPADESVMLKELAEIEAKDDEWRKDVEASTKFAHAGYLCRKFIKMPTIFFSDTYFFKQDERLLAGVIWHLCWKRGYCTATQSYLAKTLGWTRYKVCRILKRLVDRGVVVKWENPGCKSPISFTAEYVEYMDKTFGGSGM